MKYLGDYKRIALIVSIQAFPETTGMLDNNSAGKATLNIGRSMH